MKRTLLIYTSLFITQFCVANSFVSVPPQDPTKYYVDSLDAILNNAERLYVNEHYKSATEQYLQIINNCELSKNDKCFAALVHSYNGLAEVYRIQDLYEDALEYANTAIEYANIYNDDILRAYSYTTKGNILSDHFEFNTDQNNKLKNPALANNPKQARSAYYNALKIFQDNEADDVHVTMTNMRIGNTYVQEENYYEAEKWFVFAAKRADKLNNEDLAIQADMNLAFIYSQLGYYREAIEISKNRLYQIKSPTLFATRQRLHYNLAQSYLKINEPDSAFQHLEASYELLRQETRETKREEILEIKEKYENEKLNNKNLELETESLAARAKANKAYFISLIVGICFILLLAASLIISLRNRYKQQNLQLKIIRNQQESEIKTINALIDGKEAERSNIGRFLHDQVASLLNSANIHLEVLANQYEIDNPLYEKTQGILDDVADKIRTLSHHLLSDVLLKFGLTVALDDLCERLSTPKIAFEFQTNVQEQKRYKKSIENKLYSIAQELSNNVLKHSKATNATIELRELGENLVMNVIDNGIGMNQDILTNNGNGVGLQQIRLRVRSIGGEMTVHSDGFTRIEISIPLVIAETKTKKPDKKLQQTQ